MSQKIIMTDTSWELLKQICACQNNDDWQAVKKIIDGKLEQLECAHWEAVLWAIDVTDEFISQDLMYITELLAVLEKSGIELSLKESVRYGYIRAVVTELNNKK